MGRKLLIEPIREAVANTSERPKKIHFDFPRSSSFNALSSFRNSISTYSRARRVAIAILILAVAGLNSACRKAESVATVTDENEAIEIVSILNEKGIEAQKEEVGEEGAKRWKVSISDGLFSSNKLPLAFQVLKERGLPRQSEKGMEGAYEEKGMFPSDSAQKAQRLKELKTEIERQLRLLPTVVRVSVNIVLPEDDSLTLNPYPATASVLLINRSEEPPFAPSQVRDLVTRSVPKLKGENVGVVIIHEPGTVAVAGSGTRKPKRTLMYGVGGIAMILTSILSLLLFQANRQRKSSVSPDLGEPTETPNQALTDSFVSADGQHGVPVKSRNGQDGSNPFVSRDLSLASGLPNSNRAN
jgi:type III secretion system YscJ/HrcJ family lipoprotein